MIRVQRWLGFCGTSSNGSLIAGNVPPAVRGPFDAENSVATMAPLDDRRTRPAVSATARFVLAHSNVALPLSHVPPLAGAAAGLARRAAPPYTWHAVDVARRGVAAGAGVAVLREGVRARRDGLGPQGVHSGAAAGVAPAGRHLSGDDAAEVALDGHVVDDPPVAGTVAGELDPPAVVGDRAVVGAQAEHVAGRARSTRSPTFRT